MTTATKNVIQMTVSELLEVDRETGVAMDELPRDAVGVDWTTALELLGRRREVRAELNRRFEMSKHSDCPTTDAELDAISKQLHV
jgi:hypothetical protein